MAAKGRGVWDVILKEGIAILVVGLRDEEAFNAGIMNGWG